MKKALGIGLVGTAFLVALLVIIVVIFDIRTPPENRASSWHAYLTEDEKDHPLAQYWFSRAEPDPQVLSAINAGPLDHDEVLQWDNRASLLEADYHSAENGWRRMEDGSGYVAVRTFFPGATAEMVDWWFEWAQREEDIRYKIWYPGAHYAMSQMPTPEAPDYDDPKPYWGKSRFPVEDVGVGVSQLRLDFVSPAEFGFEELPEGSTLLAVRVGVANGLFKTTDMIHFVRPVEGGVEMRSRFWIARDLEAMSGGIGLAAVLANNSFVKQRIVPDALPRELALHCANEYSQLASFLPELYQLYGPAADPEA